MLARVLRLGHWRDAAGAALALTALFHGRALWRGYYRWDDFAFLQMADRTALAENLFAPHNDHLLPLWRLEVEALYGLFGLSPVGYIVVTLLSFAAMLALLERFLAARAVSLHGRWLALAVASSWASWAELTSGYFTLTVYLQIVAIFFAAVAAERRARADGGGGWLALMGALALVAIGLDVSGFWVVLAVPVVALADGDWQSGTRAQSLRRFAPSLSVCAAVFMGAALATVTAVKLWYPGLAVTGADQSASLVDRVTVAGAATGSVMLATWRALDYAIPGSPLLPVLHVLLVGTTALALVLGWRQTSRGHRQLVIALGLVILMHALMVAAGRPFLPAEFPAKHIGIAFLMFVAAVAVLWPSGSGRRATGQRVVVAVITLVLVSQLAANVFAARRGYPVTAKVELWLASERKRSVTMLRDSIIAPLLAAGVTSIPTVPVGPLEAATKDLRFYDLSVYRPFFGIPDGDGIRFVRDATMPHSVVEAGVEVVPDVWVAAGPRFAEFVRSSKLAQRLWTIPAPSP